MQWTKWRFLRLILLTILVLTLISAYLKEGYLPAMLFSSKQILKRPVLDNSQIIIPERINQPVTPSITPTRTVSPTTKSSTSTKIIATVAPRPVAPTQIIFPNISDSSVIAALNQYRSNHRVHQLVENAALCNYAQKRVQDLVAGGGLDGHAGFRADFADNNIPDQLKDYSGRTIGENLAYQYCINMQTNENFVANSAAALIEWCFDSSTKGHREAQLNPAFNNVCVRHQDGLFVVIFGD